MRGRQIGGASKPGQPTPQAPNLREPQNLRLLSLDPKKSTQPQNIHTHTKHHDQYKQLTNDDNVELESTFQELVLNLLRDTVEADIGLCANLFSRHFSRNVVGL